MSEISLVQVVEAALFAAGEPLSLDRLTALFEPGGQPTRAQVRAVLDRLAGEYQSRGIELVEVGGGFRIQVRQELAPWVGRLWQEKPPRYSRALLETLVLIAYRQPITRGEIEQVRGVAVSTGIVRTLFDRAWIRVVGHRDVPGKPALYATTTAFLDYFNLESLADLPSLAELQALSDPETPANAEHLLGLSEPDEQIAAIE